jgi:hypothetical protein
LSGNRVSQGTVVHTDDGDYIMKDGSGVPVTQSDNNGNQGGTDTTKASDNPKNIATNTNSVDISLDVKTGSITYASNGATATYNLSEWLYDPTNSSFSQYDVQTQYELAKLTNAWYTTTNQNDRNAIESMLANIQRTYKTGGLSAVRSILENGLRNIGLDITSFVDKIVDGSSLDDEIGNIGSNKVMYLMGAINYLAGNALNTGNLVHYDELNGGTGEWLNSELRDMYENTVFRFASRGAKGVDVTYVSGQHPSEYDINPMNWQPGNNFGDFKPGTYSGYKTFLRELGGKIPMDSEYLPYNPETGKLIPKVEAEDWGIEFVY